MTEPTRLIIQPTYSQYHTVVACLWRANQAGTLTLNGQRATLAEQHAGYTVDTGDDLAFLNSTGIAMVTVDDGTQVTVRFKDDTSATFGGCDFTQLLRGIQAFEVGEADPMRNGGKGWTAFIAPVRDLQALTLVPVGARPAWAPQHRALYTLDGRYYLIG